MPTKYWHAILIAVVVLVWLALSCFLGGQGAAAFREPDKTQAKEAPAGKFYYGATKSTCGLSGCHSSAPPSDEMYVCKCTEFTTWQEKDKHAKAFLVLRSERSKRMGQMLWNDPDVTKRNECLSCHAVVLAKADRVHESFHLEQGVTCVVCHGPYRKWVDDHQVFGNREQFRAESPAEKEKKYGLKDLWTPSKRAALCASCHVGSIEPGEEDKFVTHDMYAAGHPPLPSFETATFSDQMPRHWRYRYEKRDDLSKRFPNKREEAAKILHHFGEGEERTRLALVSAAVVLRDSMLLLVRQAERCNAGTANQQALDMANFDCYACHHDLKSPSWRQKRGYVGKPGRPPLHSWPIALMKLAIPEAADSDAEAKELWLEFEKKLQQLQTAIEDRPYGNPEKIVPAANALAQWAGRLTERLEKKKCDAGVARRIRRDIPLLFQKETLDYDSARQVAWIFKIINEEIGERDTRVQEILAGQDKVLKLHLPSGQERDIVKELKSGLEILNSYEPDQFKKALQQLSRCLERKPRRDAVP